MSHVTCDTSIHAGELYILEFQHWGRGGEKSSMIPQVMPK